MIEMLHQLDIAEIHALGNEGEELNFYTKAVNHPQIQHLHKEVENDLLTDDNCGFTLVP